MSLDNLAILTLVSTAPAITMPWPMKILGTQVRVGPHWTPIRSQTERRVPSPSHHGGIPLGILSILAHCWVCQNTPFLGPQIQAPIWSIGGPISWCPWEARTFFEVLHLDMSRKFRLLSYERWVPPWLPGARMGITSILPIFCHL